MNVLPVLLLLVQLVLVPLVRTDEALPKTPASSVVTKLSMITPSSNNSGTALDAGANKTAGPSTVTVKPPEANKPVKVITDGASSPVLVRGVTKTDTATMQVNGTLSSTTQAPQVIKLTTTTTTVATKLANSTTSKTDKLVADGVSLSDVNTNKSNINGSHSTNTNTTIADSDSSHGKPVNSSISSNSNATSNTSSTSSTTTTTSTTTTSTTMPTTTSTTTTTTRATTTTTTTVRPKKPTVTSSMEKLLEGEKLDMIAPNSGSMAPHVLPVQEMSSLANRGENEYIVPIVTVMLAVPLAIALFIIVYRRFRDLWSTRHYRRMDFLVDGMYND